MDFKLEGKTILVTAASRGLGYSVAEAVVHEGATVIICSRNKDALKAASQSLGHDTRYHVVDLSKGTDIDSLIDRVKDDTPVLDGLFVNAGGPPPGTFLALSDQDWYMAYNLTLMSAVRLTRRCIPLLKNAKEPSILYSTSISVKEPIDNLLLSNSIRPAVIGLMRTLSHEIGPAGIRVNAICPGYIKTDRVKELLKFQEQSSEAKIVSRIPLGRIGNPKEFGTACAFLLSPVSSYIHGSLLLIDGGLYRGMM